MPDPQTQTLAQRVRAKYPGVYDDLSDADLETKVKAKYPGVYDDIPTTQAETAKPPAAPTLRERLYGIAPSAGTAYDLVAGAAKGLGSTAIGASEVVNRGASRLGLTPQIDPAVFERARGELTTPTGPAQAIGKGAEQLGELVTPLGAESAAVKAFANAPKWASFIAKVGANAAELGVKSAAQTGQPKDAVSGALMGATGTGLSAMLGKGLTWTGERIEKSLMKASTSDVQNGFRIENVYKHGLGGTLGQSLDKSTERLRTLSGELKTELGRIGPNGRAPEVDIVQALADAAKDLQQGASKTMGRNQAIEAAVNKLLDDPALAALKQGKADLLTANEIKQGIGDLGAWAYGKPDADSNAMELVANTFYTKLKQAIEQAAVGGPQRVQELNRAMGEIIPIRQAIFRRIPVAERANVLRLADIAALASHDLGISLANRLLTSGRTANLAVKAGTAMQQYPGTFGRILGGGGEEIIR